jgi:PD-(D/E)XK nuclease superfamily protein
VTDSGVLKLSWSRLRLHDECPAKWGLQKANKSPLTDIRNFVHGNVVDIAMRRWLSQDSPEPGWMLAHVDEIFEQCTEHSDEGVVKWKSATDRAETLEFCRELVTRLEPILQRYALPYNWTPAYRFQAPLKVPYLDGTMREILLVGEIDLKVSDREQRIAIWDLKGTRDDQYYKKVLGQLAFYVIVTWILEGRRPAMAGLLQPMCTEQVLRVTVDDDAVRQMAARITKVAQDIWAGRLVPKEDDTGCNWCDVARVCPKVQARVPSRSGRIGA